MPAANCRRGLEDELATRNPAVTLTAALLLSGSTLANSAPPRLAPGWPVPSASDCVHVGPRGGPVVISESVPAGRSTVTAFSSDGTLRWQNARAWGCGNCADGSQLPGRQPNGSYGPIGPEGNSPWSVHLFDGTTGDACTGVVLGDGNCVAYDARPTPNGEGTPALVSRGTPPWKYVPGVGPRSTRRPG